MQLEAIRLVLRPRIPWEGCDIGVRLLQAFFRPVYRNFLVVAAPLFALCLATIQIAPWLPVLLIWCLKPWVDRTILFVLSRALFGESTTLMQLWTAQRQVWWSQLLETLTLRRLSASRSFTQPLSQLEGLRGRERLRRGRAFAARHRGVARGMTAAFASAELSLVLGILILPAWFGVHESIQSWTDPIASMDWFVNLAYALVVLFLEPFYVAAGFGMYLNRRVELEAWDIEQEFRRAFAAP
jgi:hypothetical protein